MIVDRASQRPVLMVSAAGGVDIEEVAAQTPEKIHRLAVDPRYGVLPHQALSLALKLYRDMTQARAAADIMQRLYGTFYAVGASLAEINPLATTRDGALAALDAKIVIDDNELGRRPELAALRDTSAEAPSEVAAREAGLTFINLEGSVGCCVNGAGLAMATMDLVKYYGGEPANFLDIGGSSDPQKVVSALRIISADTSVRAILFNIFGGITRGDDVANGIVQATRQFPLQVPLVIRLTGTNEQLAMEILTKAGFSALTDMDEAVKQAVAKATERGGGHLRGGGCRGRADRVLSRGDSGAGHAARAPLPARARRPPHRPELPGTHLPAAHQSRHHPGQYLPPGPDWGRVAERDAHLRDRAPALGGRLRAVQLRRHRGRSEIGRAHV